MSDKLKLAESFDVLDWSVIYEEMLLILLVCMYCLDRGRKRNIQKNAYSKEYSSESREASSPFNNSGGSPVSVSASEYPDVEGNAGVGFCDGDSVAREASSDGLTSEPTIDNQANVRF